MAIQVVGIIPARYSSTRLPGKPLADILGKPMIQHTVERARLCKSLSRVIVATDDGRIQAAVQAFGGEVVMTDPAIPSGTDRVAAVADLVPAEVYVNIQGDEPLMDPRAIDAVVELVASGRYGIGTAMTPLASMDDLANRAVVKVIADQAGRAIYFSRLPIPYGKQVGPESGQLFLSQKHVGLYSYTRASLMKVRSLPVSRLERAESLEQLRWLEAGIPIGITEVEFHSIGVDTPEELEKVREWLSKKNTSL